MSFIDLKLQNWDIENLICLNKNYWNIVIDFLRVFLDFNPILPGVGVPPDFTRGGGQKCPTPLIPEIYIWLTSNLVGRFVSTVTIQKCPMGGPYCPIFDDVSTFLR